MKLLKMKSLKTLFAAAVAMMVSSSAFAMDGGDPEAGAQVFRTCSACHNVEEPVSKPTGPHLHGVINRVAGTVEDYPRYSPAMVQFGEDGNEWTKENIAEYLANPRGFVQGNRMAFAGLRQEQQIADVIAYIAQFSDETPSE